MNPPRSSPLHGVRAVLSFALVLAGLACCLCARAEGVRVLIASKPGKNIAQRLAQELRERNQRVPPDQRIEFDLRTYGPGERPVDLAQAVRASLPGYRAVFASNLGLARAIQRVAPQVPLVFQGQADPVSMCLADTLLKPGRNATGYTDYLPEDDVKALEAMSTGFPLRTVYVLVAAGNYFVPDCGVPKPSRDNARPPPCRPGITAPGDEFLQYVQPTAPLLEYAGRQSIALHFLMMCTAADFARIPTDLGAQVGFLIPWHALFVDHQEALIRRLSSAAGPAIYGRRLFAEKGGLMALVPVDDEWDQRVAIEIFYRVIEGEAPADIPIQAPRGFRLTLNASAAHRQGLKPSRLLLRRADEILR